MANTEMSFCKKTIGVDPKVLGWSLLIKAPDMPERTKGGLLLPESTKEDSERRQNIGLVLKVGPQAFTERYEHLRCKEGDWVHYSLYQRDLAYLNGHVCYYIEDDKIRSIIDEDDVELCLDLRK